MTDTAVERQTKISELPVSRDQILQDYRLAVISRQTSLVGRREVMSGKAKFGIFGDGKELPQVAMARAYRPGDFRSGYYRDQTLMFALGELSVQQFFAQLYAHADVEADPFTGGRAMNAHFATRSLNADGSWKDLSQLNNSSSDISPTGSQMPRLVGLAYASRLYRELDELKAFSQFSQNGDEVAFGTIGNASSAEGMFWETINAIGVLRAPAVITIYDDGYGISVTNEHQVLKENISELLQGFQRPPGTCCEGYDIYVVKGWDYPALLQAYTQAAEIARREHVPAIVHVVELTQPQGHSTSGSQERYKSKERLQWEAEFDCNARFREWILEQGIADRATLDQIIAESHRQVEDERKRAWQAYQAPIEAERQELNTKIDALAAASAHGGELAQVKSRLKGLAAPLRRDLMAAAREALLAVWDEPSPEREALAGWKRQKQDAGERRYSSHLYIQGEGSALSVPVVKPQYPTDAEQVFGFEVLNATFDAALARYPNLIIFGEDVGRLGDVNQACRGLQAKYGELRVSDTGIREVTILGQAIGMALRGLRPIAEIQYLDYLLYALQIMSDDLATTHWRTHGGQKAPVIVRTRGHRLEGIWHSGSPMGAILHLSRGMRVLVPRNMTQAAGFYNTLLRSDDPALVVEVLNGYRAREPLSANPGDFTLPLGVPEILRPGSDLTLVTYGACVRIVLEAADQLAKTGIEAEVIDVQTLLPFDLPGTIGESIKKTGRVVFVDEDVPGGATAYMMQEVLEKQGGYSWLDSEPRTVSGTAHRPAYGSDGDYWSKPNVEQVFETAYRLMNEADPRKFPEFF